MRQNSGAFRGLLAYHHLKTNKRPAYLEITYPAYSNGHLTCRKSSSLIDMAQSSQKVLSLFDGMGILEVRGQDSVASSQRAKSMERGA